MSKTVIAIDPVTRLEGHLKVEVQVEDGKVADAWITGGMFRGFEAILRGRNPRDASQIVQRICGCAPYGSVLRPSYRPFCCRNRCRITSATGTPLSLLSSHERMSR